VIRWGNPFFLYALILVPILALFQIYNAHRSRRLRERFASSAMIEQIAPELSTGRQRFKDFLVLAALSLLLIALADPQVGTRMEEVKREGIDLVIALDVSNSMMATDIAPSRLEKAKHEVQTLLDMLQGDRVALVAFAGKAVVECPLTLDYGAAEIFLDVMDPDLISQPGTSLGAAIQTSLKTFSEESRVGKAILLITDGEDHEEQVDAAIKSAKEQGVIIYAVGIGSPQGTPIPMGDRGGDFRRDRQGNVVVTQLDEAALKKIAAQTGGVYQRCSAGEDELKEIFAAISGLEKGELGMKKFTQYEHRYQLFLFLTWVALVLEFLMSDRRMKLPKFMRALAEDRGK